MLSGPGAPLLWVLSWPGHDPEGNVGCLDLVQVLCGDAAAGEALDRDQALSLLVPVVIEIQAVQGCPDRWSGIDTLGRLEGRQYLAAFGEKTVVSWR